MLTSGIGLEHVKIPSLIDGLEHCRLIIQHTWARQPPELRQQHRFDHSHSTAYYAMDEFQPEAYVVIPARRYYCCNMPSSLTPLKHNADYVAE